MANSDAMRYTEAMTPAITLDLPPAFYADHRSRECGASGVIVKETKKFVRVTLDADAFADLRSDAHYYSNLTVGADLDASYFGLVASARATLKRLNAVVDPPKKEVPLP